ncbi:MAG: VanW family protein [Lachnospiraceae bacterium]|nr:VanW family protein [Lachnospiraceae bacterium]
MKNRMIRLLVSMTLAIALVLSFAPVNAYAAPTKDLSKVRALFDAQFYYDSFPDVAAAVGSNENALFNHYVNFGIREGRSASASFNAMAYRNRYPDLAAAYGDDMTAYCIHYVDFGIAEGRNASSDGVLTVLPVSIIPSVGSTGSKISSYSTKFDAYSTRATNVRLAASQINGKVVQPGETFSFLANLTPRTIENGYVVATVFASGKKTKGIGGGICQVSSTLYASTFGTSLAVTERHAHSLPVTYIPKGMDATVAEGSLDLKFVNTYSQPLVIVTNADKGVLTVELYLQDL